MAQQPKPVASGVDLSNLSSAQLHALSVEAKARAIELGEKEGKAALKALKTSGEHDAIKKEFAAIGKDAKKLTRKASFDLVLPIRFTMEATTTELGEYDFKNSEKITEGDLFDYSFKAALLKDAPGITKKQREVLNNTIADYVENACDDIYELVPDELMQHFGAHAEKVDTFVKKVRGLGLSHEDLK